MSPLRDILYISCDSGKNISVMTVIRTEVGTVIRSDTTLERSDQADCHALGQRQSLFAEVNRPSRNHQCLRIVHAQLPDPLQARAGQEHRCGPKISSIGAANFIVARNVLWTEYPTHSFLIIAVWLHDETCRCRLCDLHLLLS